MLHWCQNCGRIIEDIWMTWTNATYHCFTCAGGPAVPAFPDDYPTEYHNPATWTEWNRWSRLMSTLATCRINQLEREKRCVATD